MKRCILVFLLLSYSIFAEDTVEVDNGILVDVLNDEPMGLGKIIEMKFLNKISGQEIYYTGKDSWGDGIFWIKINGERVDIIETYIRYQPMVKWHGLYIVEIFIPTGSPFRHSFFYDCRNNMVSPRIDFPIYYDTDKDYIIALLDGGLGVYDFKNMRIANVYECEEEFETLYLLVFGEYEIKIVENKLYFSFVINTRNINLEGNYVFEYY
ncbi:hypothetical protein FACS1894110_22120 [Spirochaetia bacterium]|nr:hypothetical protein FACS1894110_22120 [Spirochaetia bacterium]